MTDQSLESLIDLMRLTKRYSGSDWSNLVRILENEESRKGLIDAAKALSSAASKQNFATRDQREGSPGKRRLVLKELERSDPEKALTLKRFRDALMKGRFLRSSNQVRDFASEWGVKLPERMPRERAVNELISFMANLPNDEIQSRLRSIPADRDYGRDYDNWVRIIMGETANSQS